MTYAIEAEGLVKHYGTTKALDGVDLRARQGTVLGVLGPNGAGKTTAVRILATLIQADAGHATVGGYDIRKQSQQVRRTIGLTGQYASVDEELSGTQNLMLIGSLLDLRKPDARARAKELLSWFDLSDAADRPAKTYSGGMRRRLDLAASLVGRPDIVFLDEPTTGLDPSKREDMWGVVRGLVNEGSTILLTTQYLEEADALADEITVIDHGKVIAHDTPDGLKRIVGGQTLEIQPTDITRLPEVRVILGEVSASPIDEPRRGIVSVPVNDDKAMAHAVQRLIASDIAVTELSLRLPSLDEVFFTLTGRPADSDTTTDSSAVDVASTEDTITEGVTV